MLSRLSSLPLKILSRSDDDGVVVQPMSPFAYEDKAAPDDDSYVKVARLIFAKKLSSQQTVSRVPAV